MGFFLAQRPFEAHLAQAKRVLQDNWMGGYTRPAQGLYPHQWNWDSAFIAMGYANYLPRRARRELRHLFAAQWPDGMVPHIVFNPEQLGNYFPEPDFWQCPQGRHTSGITMPPLHAEACLHLHRLAHDLEDSRAFLAEMFPKLMAGHRYFYGARDPEREGLVYIRHPWESGRDNAPAWDAPLSAMDLERAQLPAYQRRDLDKGVDRHQRPTDRDYDRYVYLVDLFRRHAYDEAAIYQECPFLVQDVGFNSILQRDNRALQEIAGILRQDSGEIDEWLAQTSRAINSKLWSERFGRFESYDLRAGDFLDSPTAMNFMPLYAGVVDSAKSPLLYAQMNSVSFCGLRQGNCFAIPNYDMTASDYSEVNYWRGPVWLNINWMLAQGLEDYGYYFEAQILRKDILELVARFGHREYYDSHRGQGLGSKKFSWSAALFIDVLSGYYRQKDAEPGLLGIVQGSKLGRTRLLNHPEASRQGEGGEAAQAVQAAVADIAGAFFDPLKSLVNYQGIAQSPQYQRYRQAVDQLPRLDLAALDQGRGALGFWINLYNMLVIQGVIELGVKDSVAEVPDFFDRLAYQVGSHRFSLHDIYHGVLRGNQAPPRRLLPQFWPWDSRRRFCFARPDPRVHFALSCGTRSCAKVEYYRAADLEQQLDEVTAAFIISEVLVDPEENRVALAELFSWYQADFGGQEGVLRFAARFMPEDEHKRYLLANLDRVKVEYLFHDWHLNR